MLSSISATSTETCQRKCRQGKQVYDGQESSAHCSLGKHRQVDKTQANTQRVFQILRVWLYFLFNKANMLKITHSFLNILWVCLFIRLYKAHHHFSTSPSWKSLSLCMYNCKTVRWALWATIKMLVLPDQNPFSFVWCKTYEENWMCNVWIW